MKNSATSGFGKRRDDFRPVKRSAARLWAGKMFYSAKCKLLWRFIKRHFPKDRGEISPAHLHFAHKTPLSRNLRGDDMVYQQGKIKNLSVALPRLSGIVLHPGQVMSFCYLIGKPSKRRGFVPGMVLTGGRVSPGIGGGLCQMSNLIYWITLHTPLTVVQRYRHGYDVFPDSNRKQPFGSGATCAHPYLDLMIRNNTDYDFKLCLEMDDEYLRGAWYGAKAPSEGYEIVEKNHEMRVEAFGGYSRHNELWRNVYNTKGSFLREEMISENHAMMMYSPLMPQETTTNTKKQQGEDKNEGTSKDL